MKYFSCTPISSHFYPDNAIKNTAVKRYFLITFTACLLPIKHERIYVTRSNDSITLITSHEALSISLTTVIDPSHSFRMTLAVRCHSERRQECLVGKIKNGTVTQSEESMTRMTSYGFPHHGSRFFAVLRITSYQLLSF